MANITEFGKSPLMTVEELAELGYSSVLYPVTLFRVAMKAATENADEIIRNLSQEYNRARQSKITTELSEIIAGATALE